MDSGATSRPGTRRISEPKPLSCASCRQRKVKCNKIQPCHSCQRAGLECVFPLRRTQAPRKKRRSIETRDAELLRRIKRLEKFMGKVDKAGADSIVSEEAPRPGVSNPTPAPTPFLASDISKQGAQSDVHVDAQYASFIREQSSGTRRLNGEFWKSLGDEFDGLRQLVEHSVDSEEDEADETISTLLESKVQSPFFILKDPDSSIDLKATYPSDAHRPILFHFYLTNIDPLCRILHRPTIASYLANLEELHDHSTRRLKFTSLEAITFAMYFTAVTSMSTQECMAHLGEAKHILLGRYKKGTEAALAEADLLNTMELVTLQAFTLYIMAIRTNDKTRSSWTLIGLAVRIAHGIGLHRDFGGQSFSAFEAEMRRRLWWQILVLDMRAAEDRGTGPVIQEGSFHITMPSNLNDEDFGHDSQYPLLVKTGVTQMTFCLMNMDASDTIRKISFMPLPSERQAWTPQQKAELVKDCTQRIESYYLAGCDASDQSTWLVRTMGRLLALKLWLTVHYPLQGRKSAPRECPEGQALQTVMAFLSTVEAIEENHATTGFSWFFKTYVPWHALAVALAELCTETRGSLADQAWPIIDRCYNKWSERVADTKEGMLWRPIKSLLQKARAARQRNQALDEARRASQSSPFDSGLPNYDLNPGESNVNTRTNVNHPHSPTVLQDFNLCNQNTDPSLQSNLFNLMDPTPLNTGPINADSSNTPFNWDNWNEFIFDVGAVGADVPQSFYEGWPVQI